MTFFQFILIVYLIWIIFHPKIIMGTINEFKELTYSTKVIVLTFVTLIPLWIFSFAYLKPEFLERQWYVIVSIAFAISVGYYFLNLINVFFQFIVFDEKTDDSGFWIMTYVQPVIELGIIMFIVYWFNFTFKTFIYITFGINLWRCILFLIPVAFNKKVN